jgi:hypothetical protein
MLLARLFLHYQFYIINAFETMTSRSAWNRPYYGKAVQSKAVILHYRVVTCPVSSLPEWQHVRSRTVSPVSNRVSRAANLWLNKLNLKIDQSPFVAHFEVLVVHHTARLPPSILLRWAMFNAGRRIMCSSGFLTTFDDKDGYKVRFIHSRQL